MGYLPKRFDKNRYVSILYRKIFKTVPVSLDVNTSKILKLIYGLFQWNTFHFTLGNWEAPFQPPDWADLKNDGEFGFDTPKNI